MKKSIGFFGITSIASGAMISSGLFVLPGLAYAKAGPVVFLSYFIAGCIAMTTVFSLAELTTAMPKAGGDYFYVSRTFGKLFGTVSGILSWLALSFKSAFAVIGIAELVYLAFGINFVLSALVLSGLFTLLNLAGVREATRFQIILVAALMGILAVFSFGGIQQISLVRYEPFLSRGFNAMLSTAGFVFVSFGGVLTTASIAEEIDRPSRNIPMGLIASTITVTILYSLVTFITVGVVPGELLETSLAPIAAAARFIGGTPLYSAIVIASLLAFVTTANGGILTASRYPVALARDGMLPRILTKTSAKSKTHYPAIIATGLLIALSVLLNLEMLVKAASTVVLLTNIFAHLSLIVMRESKVANYLPSFKAPLYPWLQICSIIIFCFLIVDMGLQPIVMSLLFVLAGVILYFLRRGQNTMVAPALVHLLERITDTKLGTRDLAEELRAIIVERDSIVKDDFDKAIEQATVLDIEGRLELEGLFTRATQALHAAHPSLDPESLIALLRQRESESGTAISPFVAIPHIILEGEGRFNICLIRAVDGIYFSDNNESVKAVFLLIGTKDMRNLHLRALAAIAQVAQQPDFEHRWLSAEGQTDLKDIFILSERNRHTKKV